MVIAFAAIGAAIIEQQLNMAAAEAKGATNSDAIAAFLAQVTVYLSLIGFVIQVGLTSRIHRVLGIGFALLMLPVSLGTTAVIMLFNRALWAPGLARVLDTSLRYTVDKTSREVLFLPLPAELKYRAKPFIDVTMDRFAKGMGALLILVLIKDWGLGLDWQQLSYASLTMVGLWVVTAIAARREIPAIVPPQHRAAGRRAVDAAAQRSRSRRRSRRWSASWRIPSRGACSTRSTCSMRWTSGTWSRRCCWRTSRRTIRARALARGRSRRPGARRSLAAGRRTRAEGSGQRRAHRRGVGAGGAARRGRRRRDAAVPHEGRSGARDRRRRGAGRQLEARRRRGRRGDAAASSRATRASRRADGGCRWRARWATSRTRRSGRCSCR